MNLNLTLSIRESLTHLFVVLTFVISIIVVHRSEMRTARQFGILFIGPCRSDVRYTAVRIVTQNVSRPIAKSRKKIDQILVGQKIQIKITNLPGLKFS